MQVTNQELLISSCRPGGGWVRLWVHGAVPGNGNSCLGGVNPTSNRAAACGSSFSGPLFYSLKIQFLPGDTFTSNTRSWFCFLFSFDPGSRPSSTSSFKSPSVSLYRDPHCLPASLYPHHWTGCSCKFPSLPLFPIALQSPPLAYCPQCISFPAV